MNAKLRIWITGVVIALTAVTAPFAYAQISAEQTIALGRQLIDSEDYALAVQYLGKAIQAKPYLADPYYLRGLAKMLLGDFSGSVTDCTSAIEENPYMRDTYRVRGISRMQLGQDSAACADFNQGLLLMPNDRLFMYYSALAYDRLGQPGRSSIHYERLHRLYPHFIPAYTAHAQSLLAQHDTVAALSLLNNMPGAGGNSIEPTLMRTRIAITQGDWRNALRNIDIALRLMPHSDALYVNRGVIRHHMGDRAGAVADFRAALELNASNKQAIANLTGKQLDMSPMPIVSSPFSMSIEPIQTDEAQPCGLFALSFTHPYDDLHPLAYPYRELPLLNATGRYPSPIYLTGSASDTPDAEQAVALFSYAEEPLAQPSAERLMGRAVAYAMLKNYESALTDLNQVITRRPGIALAYVERAYVRAGMAEVFRQRATHGERDERLTAEAQAGQAITMAIEDIDKALAIDPDMIYGIYDKAVLTALAGDTESAMQLYDRVLSINPRFAQAYLNRGLLHLRHGDTQKAKQDWSRAGELGLTRAYTLIRNHK